MSVVVILAALAALFKLQVATAVCPPTSGMLTSSQHIVMYSIHNFTYRYLPDARTVATASLSTQSSVV